MAGLNKTFLNNTEYATNNYIINRDIKNGGIRGDEKVRQYDAGTAVAISISSVFVFVFCIIGTVYAVKHNKCNCKRYITNLTVSKGSSNTFSMDEVNQTGDGTINPILGVFQPKHCDCRIKEMYKDNANSFFVEGVVFIKKAIQKERPRMSPHAQPIPPPPPPLGSPSPLSGRDRYPPRWEIFAPPTLALAFHTSLAGHYSQCLSQSPPSRVLPLRRRPCSGAPLALRTASRALPWEGVTLPKRS